MRHYMVDPDNEERLLKIPPHVVAAIKDEAYAETREAVAALPMMTIAGNFPLYDADETLAILDALREEQG